MQKHKKSDGSIDRKLYVNIEYSFMNKLPISGKSETRMILPPEFVNHNYLIVYIQRILIYDGSILLKEISPNEKYYDWVNGMKYYEGQEKMFF